MFKHVALLLPLLALGAAPRAEFRLQDLLPEETLLFAEAPSAAAFRAAFQNTPLYKFFQDEEVRAFAGDAFDAALQNFQGFTKDFEKELGLSWDKTWELPTGQIAIGVPAIAQEGADLPDFILSVECAGKRDTLLKAVAFARKSYEARAGRKAEAWKAGEDEILSGELNGDVRWNLAVLGDVLVAATGKATIEKTAEAFRKGQPKPLSASATWKKAREKAAAKDLFLYADLTGFVRGVRERLGEDEKKFIAALGLDGFTFAAGGVTLGEKSVSERFFVGTSGEKRGLAKFLSLKGAAPGFESAPENALQFLSFSIDVADLYDTLLEIVKSADPLQHQEMLDDIAQFEKDAGVSLKNDLFPAFGPRVYNYSALPKDALIPDGVTGFEIRDAARFDKCLQAVLKNVPAELGVLEFEGKKIHYFRFSQPGGFEPARMFLSTIYFLRDGDKLVVSSLLGGFGGANALKRHILREKQPRLAAQPAVREWLGGKTDGASLVVYLDIERAFTTYYNTLAPVAVFFKESLRSGGAGVDLMKLPLGETVGKYLGQAVTKVTVEPDGLRADGLSASGMTLMTAVYAGAAAVVVLPALTRAADEAKLSQCKAQASSVYFALVSHHADKNNYPEKTGAEFFKQLKDLGYLDAEPLCPRGEAAAYRGPAKDINTLGDGDIIFCDEPGNHPDGSITILRKNGSMDYLRTDHPDYQKALEATKGK